MILLEIKNWIFCDKNCCEKWKNCELKIFLNVFNRFILKLMEVC